MTERQRREDSGLIDLDALLKEASGPELPREVRDVRPANDSTPPARESVAPEVQPPAPRVPAAVQTPAPPVAVTAPPIPRPTAEASASAPVVVAEVPPPRREKRRSGLVIAALLAAASLVVVAVVVRRPPPPAPPPRAENTAASAAANVAPRVGADPAASGAKDSVLDAKDLPPAANASASPSATVAPPTAIATARITTRALADAPRGGDADLGGAMRDAVGPRAEANAPASTAAPEVSARQLRPSPGAVVGAVQAVLPAARGCLSPGDPTRSATLVFHSDGTVAKVDLAGAHATDECVRAALAKAKLAPFVDDTFTARATVRP